MMMESYSSFLLGGGDIVTPFKMVTNETDCPSPFILSVGSFEHEVFVSAFGTDIYRKSSSGRWVRQNDGLPEGTVVNRLQSMNEKVYACTNKGLFDYTDGRWHQTDIRIPCYHAVKLGGFFAAATEYGLRCKVGTRWETAAYPTAAIYYVLLTPQYYILGFQHGISLYDRYTDSWAEFPLSTGVTCLAVYQGRLLGVTEDGELVLGNKQGGFSTIMFEGLSIYSLKSTKTGLYACTSRGLYRLQTMGVRLLLQSMLMGYPVTDMSDTGDCMYVATLHEGLKKVVPC